MANLKRQKRRLAAGSRYPHALSRFQSDRCASSDRIRVDDVAAERRVEEAEGAAEEVFEGIESDYDECVDGRGGKEGE